MQNRASGKSFAECAGIIQEINTLVKAGDLAGLTAALDAQPDLLDLQYYYTGQFGLLSFAAALGQTAICALLLERGADLNARAEHSDTPLHEAAENGHLDTVTWLLAHGALLDGRPASITSPLMNAIIFGHTQLAQLLIDAGADINRLHARSNQTPLDLALVWGQAAIEQRLRAKGASATVEKTDWTKEYGGSILEFIDSTFGRVLPVALTSIIPGANVGQRLALVNKGKNKLLFTLGLFALHTPMIELFIVLPGDWNMHDSSPDNQFPSSLLLVLADQIAKGLHIEEGFCVLADDPAYRHLAWPAAIAGVCASDAAWGAPREHEEDIPEDDKVGLWTLIPVKRSKSGMPKQSMEKNRQAGWAKLTLALDAPATE